MNKREKSCLEHILRNTFQYSKNNLMKLLHLTSQIRYVSKYFKVQHKESTIEINIKIIFQSIKRKILQFFCTVLYMIYRFMYILHSMQKFRLVKKFIIIIRKISVNGKCFELKYLTECKCFSLMHINLFTTVFISKLDNF